MGDRGEQARGLRVEAAERPVSNQCGDVSPDGLTCALERGHTCVHMRGLGDGRASYWAVGFDTDEPQGSSPAPAFYGGIPGEGGGAGAGLDLDRLAQLAKETLGRGDTHGHFAIGEAELETRGRALDVLALVERVKALEAALARIASSEGFEGAGVLDYSFAGRECRARMRHAEAALAAAGGGDPHEA